MKELTSLQIENFKNDLIKKKDDLIKKFKKNDRTKKADKEYYDYEDNKFYELKDVRNLFNQNDDDDDDICEEIEYLFNENGLEYEEIKKLMSVKVNKEYVRVIYQVVKQEEVVNYDVNYYEYEKIKKVDYIKSTPCLVDCEYIVCEIIEDQKVECCEIIENQKVEYCEIIQEQRGEIMEDQTVEDINTLKSSIIESDAIRKLNLTEDELRVITMLSGVKNYENLSKSSLIKEINEIKLSEEPKKIVFKKHPKKYQKNFSTKNRYN